MICWTQTELCSDSVFIFWPSSPLFVLLNFVSIKQKEYQNFLTFYLIQPLSRGRREGGGLRWGIGKRSLFSATGGTSKVGGRWFSFLLFVCLWIIVHKIGFSFINNSKKKKNVAKKGHHISQRKYLIQNI